ncbi:MAG: ATP-dependent metallopeptidase FtsH/Yme1/Tma family protein, partial [Lentibacter algarum]
MGNTRNIAFWVILFVMILMLFNLFSGSNTAQPSSARSYSEFVQAVQDGAVQEA